MSVNFNPGGPKPLSTPLKPADAGTAKTSEIGTSPPLKNPQEGVDFASLKDVLAAVEDSGDPRFKDGIISQEELHNYITASQNDPTKNNSLVFKTAEKLDAPANGAYGKISIREIDGLDWGGNKNQRLDLGDQKGFDFWMTQLFS